jgi:hypothetical protein
MFKQSRTEEEQNYLKALKESKTVAKRVKVKLW